MKERILIISDDQTGESLRRTLEGKKFDVTLTENADDGYQQTLDSRFHLVVVNMDEALTGLALIKRIRANASLSQLQVLTIAEWGTGQATIALAQGADAFEPKPFEADRLVDAIERLLRPTRVMTARASAMHGELEES